MEQIHLQSLAGAVAQRLRDAIISGKLRPGERLVEQKLAAHLGTSQPTVREALKELEYEGFVRKIPKKGTHVTELSPEDVAKIQEVRLALEIVAIQHAAEKITQASLKRLERMVREMEAAAREFDRNRFHKVDLRFHDEIWELAGNEYLGLVLRRTVFSLFAFVLVTQGKEAFVAAAQQHRDILEGLRTGDSAKAARAFLDATRRFWSNYHQVHDAEGVFFDVRNGDTGLQAGRGEEGMRPFSY